MSSNQEAKLFTYTAPMRTVDSCLGGECKLKLTDQLKSTAVKINNCRETHSINVALISHLSQLLRHDSNVCTL